MRSNGCAMNYAKSSYLNFLIVTFVRHAKSCWESFEINIIFILVKVIKFLTMFIKAQSSVRIIILCLLFFFF